jgi:hypothetical protein
VNVTGQLQQIGIFFYKNASIATLQKMTDPIMPSVKLFFYSRSRLVFCKPL